MIFDMGEGMVEYPCQVAQGYSAPAWYIGIDPGMRNMGCTAISGSGIISNIIKPYDPPVKKNSVLSDYYRCVDIKEILVAWLSNFAKLGSRIASVAVEGPSYASQGKRVQAGFVHKTIYDAIFSVHQMYKSDFELHIVPPRTLKKWLTGNGNASKDRVRSVVAEKIPPKFITAWRQDQYEAYALALLGRDLCVNAVKDHEAIESFTLRARAYVGAGLASSSIESFAVCNGKASPHAGSKNE